MQLKQSLFSAPKKKIFFPTKMLLPSGHGSDKLDFLFPHDNRTPQIEPMVNVAMDKKSLLHHFLP